MLASRCLPPTHDVLHILVNINVSVHPSYLVSRPFLRETRFLLSNLLSFAFDSVAVAFISSRQEIGLVKAGLHAGDTGLQHECITHFWIYLLMTRCRKTFAYVRIANKEYVFKYIYIWQPMHDFAGNIHAPKRSMNPPNVLLPSCTKFFRIL